MKKSAVKLIAFSIVLSSFSMTSCKVNSGYGCDYTEARVPIAQPVYEDMINESICYEYKVELDLGKQ